MTIPVMKPKLKILVSCEIFEDQHGKFVRMSDGLHYTHSDFIKYPVKTRFAVLFEMECHPKGKIVDVKSIHCMCH